MMMAVVMTAEGGPEVLQYREIEAPEIATPTQIKVRLRAAGDDDRRKCGEGGKMLSAAHHQCLLGGVDRLWGRGADVGAADKS